MVKLFYFNIVSEKEKGILKKINYQIKSFQKNNCYIKSTHISNNIFCYENIPISNYRVGYNIFSKLKNKVEDIILFKKLKKRDFYENFNYIYVRYLKTDPWTLSYYNFLKKIGKKIIIEVPTYPYDAEKKNNFFTKLDKKYRMELYKYVDKIVTYSDDKEIWGIPCINISNGIDLDEVKLINKVKNNDNKIVFTSVSNCSFWHGIDRFLYSLLEYKKNNSENNIIFNIVGEGAETSKLKKIVENNPLLKDCVIFYGFKSGKELDEIYNQTDIGVGSLGNFRKGIFEGGGLKNQEYCAKGLPFMIAGYDNNYLGVNFMYKVSSDESLFNLPEIIKWYRNLNITPQEIRKFAEDNLTWDIQIKKIIENI